MRYLFIALLFCSLDAFAQDQWHTQLALVTTHDAVMTPAWNGVLFTPVKMPVGTLIAVENLGNNYYQVKGGHAFDPEKDGYIRDTMVRLFSVLSVPEKKKAISYVLDSLKYYSDDRRRDEVRFVTHNYVVDSSGRVELESIDTITSFRYWEENWFDAMEGDAMPLIFETRDEALFRKYWSIVNVFADGAVGEGLAMQLSSIAYCDASFLVNAISHAKGIQRKALKDAALLQLNYYWGQPPLYGFQNCQESLFKKYGVSGQSDSPQLTLEKKKLFKRIRAIH